MYRPDQIKRISVDSEGLLLDLDVGQLKLSPLSEGSLRVSMQFDNEQPLDYFSPQAEQSYSAAVLECWLKTISQRLSMGQYLQTDQPLPTEQYLPRDQALELEFGNYQICIHQQPLYLSIKYQGCW